MIVRSFRAIADASRFGSGTQNGHTVALAHLRTVNPFGESPAIEARREMLLLKIEQAEREAANVLLDIRDLTAELIARRL